MVWPYRFRNKLKYLSPVWRAHSSRRLPSSWHHPRLLKKHFSRGLTQMNADKSFVFYPRSSAFIGGHRSGRVFQQAPKPVPLNLCFFARRDDSCSPYHILILWGRLVTCRRLQIGLLNVPTKFSNRPINIGRQVTNLTHKNQHQLRRSRTVPPLANVQNKSVETSLDAARTSARATTSKIGH